MTPITNKLSVVSVIQNEEKQIEDFLNNIKWVNELVLVDNLSTDNTVSKARKFTTKIYSNAETNLGLLKRFALKMASGDWILLLDADERISKKLKREIISVLRTGTKYDAFSIPYQNHFLGHRLTSKGQQYSKVRLFRKSAGSVLAEPVHEEVVIKGKIGNLSSYIFHYSFRTIYQTLRKFTDYARVESTMFIKRGVNVHLKQLLLYPLHMFWSIFVEGEGWKDGVWGFGVAVCFAYYEFARYYFLFKETYLSDKKQPATRT